MSLLATHLANISKNDSGIDEKYEHVPKYVTPGETVETPGAVLKWYAVHPADRAVPDEITQLARSYLMKNDLEAKGFGFVILHRCGKDFFFLIVSTWRNNNELWETVFYKNGDAMADFVPFPRDAAHKPTFCVWQMVPLWHEQKSWERFLKSSRDDVDRFGSVRFTPALLDRHYEAVPVLRETIECVRRRSGSRSSAIVQSDKTRVLFEHNDK